MLGETTNLERIKARARTFVYLNIKVDEKYGVFVQHPFFGQVINGLQEGNEVKLIDLRIPEDLQKMREKVLSNIDAVEKYAQFLFIVRKPFLPAFFKYTYMFLSLDDFSESLSEIWTSVEFPNEDVNVSMNEFVKFFKMARKDKLMEEKEYEVYDNLSEKITVYRGICKNGSPKSLSWTTDFEKAKWFSERWGDNGKVFKGIISKESVLAYFSRRNESEIIIDFNKLTNMEEITFGGK